MEPSEGRAGFRPRKEGTQREGKTRWRGDRLVPDPAGQAVGMGPKQWEAKAVQECRGWLREVPAASGRLLTPQGAGEK